MVFSMAVSRLDICRLKGVFEIRYGAEVAAPSNWDLRGNSVEAPGNQRMPRDTSPSLGDRMAARDWSNSSLTTNQRTAAFAERTHLLELVVPRTFGARTRSKLELEVNLSNQNVLYFHPPL